jgi:hypothetical protein
MEDLTTECEGCEAEQIFRIAEFLDIVLLYHEGMNFGNWICFQSQVNGWEDTSSVVSIRRN